MSPEAIRARAIAYNSDPTRAERHYRDLQQDDLEAFINEVHALRPHDPHTSVREAFWEDQAQSAGEAPL